jgi:hypothetical protein
VIGGGEGAVVLPRLLLLQGLEDEGDEAIHFFALMKRRKKLAARERRMFFPSSSL